ncbi:MAG: hypothetical protein Q7U57_12430 [Methylovulum sp.]|nr:hypothetical protein [Methylovulum sp.]
MKTINKTITIVSLIDVVGALANDTLNGNIYLMDNNKSNGSSDQGTEVLKTLVKEGDQLVWTVMSLEPEAYASIKEIIIDSDYCVPEQKTYEGSDVTYWVGKVKKNPKSTPYNLKIQVGTQEQALMTTSSPSLVGS